MPRPEVLLLTDIVDSTQITQQLGDAGASALWQAHDRQARALLAPWGGREIDKSDGLLLLFAGVADAVAYAAAYHRVLAGLEPPLQARVAIHTGPLWLRENPASEVALGAKMLEVDGLAKAVVARLMSLARGGQTLLSQAARDVLAADGQAGMDEPRAHGHWRLKGVPEPLAVWAVGEGAETPPQDSPKAWRVIRQDGDLWLPVQALPHSLPAERDRFFGRRQALAQLAALIGGGARLVSLVGMGGMGKTRLAQHFGWQSQGEFAGGIWFCDLSAAQSVDGLVHAVAQGLALPLTGADPVAQIGQALAGRGDCLVVADNFEQITRHAPATLGRWLDAAPRARFLVTTREVLGLPGEQVLMLEPLEAEEGAQLFASRAEPATGRPLAGDQVAALDLLVAMLDGMPLALELAASRARLIAPSDMLRRMGERFRLLASSGGRPDRQATMRATLDWSWDLLDEAERMALSQLAVFEGGFTLALAEAVIELPGDNSSPWTLDLLQSLVQKSLVRAKTGDRFDQLRTVQDYAAEQLAAMGQVDATQARHAQALAALARKALARGQAEDSDLENLVAAARRASQTGDAESACLATAGAWEVLRRLGPIQVAAELAELALTKALPGSHGAALAHAVAGGAAALLGHLPEAVRQLRTGLSAAGDDVALQVRLRSALAECLGRQGQREEAGQLLGQAEQLAMHQPLVSLRCLALNEQGDWWFQQSQFERAEACFRQALDWARGAGNRWWEGGLLGNLGAIAHLQGQADLARSRYEEALAMAHDASDRRWEGNTRCNLGLLHQEAGRHEDAALQFDAALSLARHLGHRRLEATVLCNLGLLRDDQGRRDEAAQCYQTSADVAEAAGDPRGAGQALSHLGLCQARLGRHDEARQSFERGLGRLLQVHDAMGLGLLYCARAEAEGMAGDKPAAATALGQARQVLRESGAGEGSLLALRLAALSGTELSGRC